MTMHPSSAPSIAQPPSDPSGPFAGALPLVAILRGLESARAVAVGEALVIAGFRFIEVPLNRPGALDCIRLLRQALPDAVQIGGGTMLTLADVEGVAQAGGNLMVAPNCNPAVIRHARANGMLCMPGVATPTEAFAALEAGAQVVKAFPAETIGPAGLRAWLSVLPAGTPVLPVGGVSPERLAGWREAGAAGAGIGSPLFVPDRPLDDIRARARAFVAAWV